MRHSVLYFEMKLPRPYIDTSKMLYNKNGYTDKPLSHSSETVYYLYH